MGEPRRSSAPSADRGRVRLVCAQCLSVSSRLAASMTAPPTIIRCSALTGYPDCNRRGAARLFWREISSMGFRLRSTPRGIGAAIGSAVHKAAEIILKEKAETGHLPPSTVAADCAAETLDESIREGVEFDRVTANRVEGEVTAVGMARAYHRVVAPEIEPLQIEQRLEAEVMPGLILSGTPDLVCREPNRIRDLKTSTRMSGGHWPQLGAYSLIVRSNNIEIEEAAVDSIRRVAIGKVQPDPTSKPVAIAQAETAAARILAHIWDDLQTFRHGDAEKHILAGDPWSFTANPSSILCSAKYCSAHGTEFCQEWRQNEK
jgi:hypothetical protein